MKTIDKNFKIKNFKIKNLRNIFLSFFVGLLSCTLLCFESTFLYGLPYLYVGFPLLVIFFGSKPKVLKKRKIVDIEGRIYKKESIIFIPFLLFGMFIVSCVTIVLCENAFKEYLPQGLIYSLPFVVYHVFCALFSHPLSLVKCVFVLNSLQGQRDYVPYNPQFPSSQSFSSYISNIYFHDYYYNPMSPGYRHRK